MLGRKFIHVLCRTVVCLACLLAIEMVACSDGGKLSQTIIGTQSIDIGGSRLAKKVSIQDLSGSLIQCLSEQGHAGRFRSAAYRIAAENADTLSISTPALGEFTVVRSGVTSAAELFFVSTHDGFMGAHPEPPGPATKRGRFIESLNRPCTSFGDALRAGPQRSLSYASSTDPNSSASCRR